MMLTVVFILLFASPISSHAVSSSAQGYVKYNIAFTNGTETKTFTVSESVQPSQTSGYSQLTLSLSSRYSNVTYTRLENSSKILFPILLVTNSQSFNYQTRGISFDFSITREGTSTTRFNGTSYQLTSYNFRGTFTFGNFPGLTGFAAGAIQARTVSGQLTVLPSNLLYSAQVNISQTQSVKIQLASTSVALDPAASTSPLTSEIILGGSIAGIVIALALGIFYGLRRLIKRSVSVAHTSSEKPSYWVD